ncbi:MAG: S9 family peptidase [Gammaproteobacteria bacterium]|nr:S9 family peptidase [Gammaproteobacteria bacterium]|tara:strand:+ start:4487 stop:6862 length:2376 start_codon:yes stop_codon:yes gene_type:complete
MKFIAGRQHFIVLFAASAASLIVGCSPASVSNGSITGETVTLADYQRAEQMLAANTAPLIVDNILDQYWQSGDRLVYKKSTSTGSDYVIVDATSNSRAGLFDLARLAIGLADYSEQELDNNDLELSRIALATAQPVVEFDFEERRYRLNLDDYVLQQLEASPDNEFISPDGNKAAFIEDHNLWLRDTATNSITQLTFDGEQNYGYATNNAGWIRGDGPVLLWSPDSRKIATFRHDGRNVGEMYLYNTQVGHPELDAWKYPLPGDDSIFMIERIVIHLDDQPRIVRLNMPPDPHRSTTSDHVASRGGEFLDVEWSEDGRELAFVSSSRDHKVAQLRVADIETGAVRDVFREEAASYFESGYNSANWRVWHDRNEFIWFSEVDNWGHLYLHDLASGELKQQLTTGSWAVLQIQRVDVENEQLYFTGSNREPGDPYYQYLYRMDFDGNKLINLTPEPANHVISWSQSEQYFTDIYSTPTSPPTAVIRDSNGLVVTALEEVDISALVDSSWIPPLAFTVKARDQQTDLYGLMYRPSNLDENLSYPILNYLYPGPQSGSVGSRSFQASRADKQALAELGFVVVEVDGMGTPGRSKSFHDAYYGNMGDNGVPDQVSAIRQLAQRYPWMDLDRVGIWGHSGGGFASTAAILRYPDFYKVAVSGAGNHDNRNYEDDWGEKWQGLLETYPETNPTSEGDTAAVAATNYDNQANQLLADQLQGKLLLAHGMMDTNVHPSSTLLVVEALIEAEKDFDLLVLPNAGHGFGNRRYFMKRRWDYFVEHLKNLAPPAEFRFADNIR